MADGSLGSARKNLNKVVQRDIFCDFRKQIILVGILGLLIVILAMTTLFTSGQLQKILLVGVCICGVLTFIGVLLLYGKIKRAEEYGLMAGEALIAETEKRSK